LNPTFADLDLTGGVLKVDSEKIAEAN